MPGAASALGLTTEPGVDGAVVQTGSWLQPAREVAVTGAPPAVDLALAPTPRLALANFVAEERSATASDGTLVPISILHGTNLPRDRRRPTILETFGSFGVTSEPRFAAARVAWLERGGVYAICHPRGGGWYGETWHRAGMLAAKTRAIDDTVACARQLIERGFTSPGLLVLAASGAGGIAAGGALVRQPELFAAFVEDDAVSDPIRRAFEADGPGDGPEFGSLEEPADVRALLAASPYAGVPSAMRAPAVLLQTHAGSHVAAWQAATFAARLRAATTSRRPVLLDEEASEESGASRVATLRDAYAFAFWQTGDVGFGFVPILTPDVGTAPPHSKRKFSR